MTKRKPSKPLNDADTVEGSLVDHARGLYMELVRAVQSKIATGDINTTLLRELASVMRAAATLDAEQRSQKRADTKAARLSIPELMERIRQLDPMDRARIARDIDSMNASPRSGLA